MGNTILYPFSISCDNKSTFIQTLQTAKRMAAEVVCFTAVGEEESLDEAYLHLLKLNGHFQTFSNNWKNIEIKIRKSIKVGRMEKELAQFIEEENVDLIICQPEVPAFDETFLTELIKDKSFPPDLLTLDRE